MKNETLNVPGTTRIITSCEDPHTQYAEFPDGLRLIYRDGKYVGWYLPEGGHGK